MTSPTSTPAGAELVTVGYGGDPVVRDLTLDIPDGKVTSIVGPNGCGKSTLLRTLARLLKPTSGRVRARRRADRRHADPRDRPAAVRCCRRARSPPTGCWCATWSAAAGTRTSAGSASGRARTRRSSRPALALTDTADLRDRPLDQLSGGQRQRAWIAMTLAQDTDLMLLDEPTTYLDLAHQVEVLDLVARLNRERGRTVAMVLHDLNLAARYSDVVIVAQGRRRGRRPGDPAEVFTVECCARSSASRPTCSPTRAPGCRSWSRSRSGRRGSGPSFR